MEDEELAKLLPSPASKLRLQDLLVELQDIESVSRGLQWSDINLLDVRAWFGSLIASKQSDARYLELRSLSAPDIEADCVRVHKGQDK
ncbi:Hypothetical protein PHPALM_5873 [Phytophthora palmivora]|uniref:Uncharacterized protein n=1 Tax=Phytophthora palmivora TaxID=4796 RepID=A0A2P4YG97_9STRA|nr:Hypothetical protein PHPALM_5873 [Phytophthora palmivora]